MGGTLDGGNQAVIFTVGCEKGWRKKSIIFGNLWSKVEEGCRTVEEFYLKLLICSFLIWEQIKKKKRLESSGPKHAAIVMLNGAFLKITDVTT